MTPSPTGVWAQIQHSTQWGRLEDGPHIGLCRESLTDSDRNVRDWFVSEARAIGAEVKVDKMGNIFAILPGENNSLPPIGMGSHLDSQPAGGRFDGILGVLSALEVLKTIKARGIKTYAPLAAIDWTNEEGSRFTKMCTGSGVWSGNETLEECHNLVVLATPKLTMQSELQRIGYLGEAPCSHQENALSAHFELHIEQGTRLERRAKKLAVVSGVQGMRWYSIRCKGAEAHAGATPVADRADALLPLARFAIKVEELSLREKAFGTVGVLTTGTSSPNTVIGSGFCTLDLRHPSETVLDRVEQELKEYLCQIEIEKPGITLSMEKTWAKTSVQFDPIALQCVRSAAVQTVGDEGLVDEFESCAAHDSAETARVTPTAMIFVPSKDGVSHNPAEFTSEEDCETGAQTLLRAVLEYDNHLRKASKL